MKINDVYKAEDESLFLRGLHRVLWLDRELDEIVLIPIPDVAAGDKRRYFRGPHRRRLSQIKSDVVAGRLVETPFRLAGVFTMSDTELEKRYPPHNGTGGNILAIRDTHFELIEATVKAIRENPQSFFSEGAFRGKIAAAAREATCAERTFRNALNRYLALGCGKNAVLPLTYLCGAPGKEREQNRPLGNTSNAFKAGLIESAGYVLKHEDKQNLGWGYYAFLKKDGNIDDAYDQTMALFWSRGDKIVDGQAVPDLLPPHLRPTIDQFKRWGPLLFDNEEAWKKQLGFKEYENNYRAYFGTAMDGIVGVGQVAGCDATSIDNQLVSRFSRLDPIGTATRMIVLEGFSTSLIGYHLGLNAPSGETALLAVLSSATSKVDFCARYGVDMTDAQFPSVYCARYLVDNGEFRTTSVMDALTANDSSVELVESYRGDRKPYPEAGHRSFHKGTGHRTHGTTRGKQRARGEDPPATKACWTIDEWTRLDLQFIRHLNTSVRVEEFYSNHPYHSRMKADGVRPYRAEIHAWGVEQGLIYSPPFNENVLRAAFLPRIRAVIKENGVHLRRPDCGNRLDLIKGPRFYAPYLDEAGLMEKARRSGVIRTEVLCNPNDLSSVWYPDNNGFHQLTNRSNDVPFTRTGTLQDCIAIQKQDAIQRELDREYTDQARTEFVVTRETNDAHYYREKQREIAQQEKPPSKAELGRGVRANRIREIAAQKDTQSTSTPPISAIPTSVPPAEPRPADLIDKALEEHRHGK